MKLEQLASALQSLDAQAAETVQAAVEQIAALTKDNDDIHELAEHYRVENGRLRGALEKITALGRGWGVSDSYAIARAALGDKP